MTLLIVDLNKENVKRDGKYNPDIDQDYIKTIEDNDSVDAVL